MKEKLTKAVWQEVTQYRKAQDLPLLWRQPLLAFTDAGHPGFLRLRQLVLPDHYLPQDLLPGARIIVCYFLPFSREVIESNRAGRYASPLWVMAYQHSAQLLYRINRRLCQEVAAAGGRAVIPQDTGYAAEGVYKSRWSQRHIAWLGGLGTFGKNNLLITDSGCCGYGASVVTDLQEEPGAPLEQERCLLYREGSCGACVGQCPNGALAMEGFCRERCYAMCMENAAHYQGQFPWQADACGKCGAGLPCSWQVP